MSRRITIEERKYETILIAKGIPKEKIRKYGFAFEGKRVLIGSSNNDENVIRNPFKTSNIFN